MKSWILGSLLTIGAAAHASLPCDVYLAASSDEGVLRGLIARTKLSEKLGKRLSDAEFTALGAPESEELRENEARWTADAAAESISRRSAYTAMISNPLGRGLLLQESVRSPVVTKTRDQLIEETIFHEFGLVDASYKSLFDIRDRLSHAATRLGKHVRTLGRVIGYANRARWWAGGVHVAEANWSNVNPLSLAYRLRARQLAARMSRTLQADMIEIELLLEPGHPIINEVTGDEGLGRLMVLHRRLENTMDQLNVSRTLVDGRVTEIVTRVKTLLPRRD